MGTYTRTPGGSDWTKLAIVDITGKTLGEIQNAINVYFTASQDVTVIGKNQGGLTGELTLAMSSDITWEAEYSGIGQISLYDGEGEFVLAPTGKLTSSVSGGVISLADPTYLFNGRIIVRGMITNTGNGHGIYCVSGTPTIIVDGGGIDVDGSAIQESSPDGMTVIIRSGTLTSLGSNTINLSGTGDKLAILGGTLTSAGTDTAVVRAGFGGATKIYVAGGTIDPTGGIMNDKDAIGYYADDADKAKFRTNGNLSFEDGTNLFLYNSTDPGHPAPWW